MKQLQILVILLLAITLCACQNDNPIKNPISTDDPIVDIQPKNPVRETLKQNNDLFGIAFLGYYEHGYDELNEYFTSIDIDAFIKDIDQKHYIETAGDELYCIVTQSETAEITVYESILDENAETMLKKGKQLYHSSDGQPIIVKGNLSDLYPDLWITVKEDATSVDYHPYIDLMTGKVSQPVNGPTLYDFTQYDKVIPAQPFDTETLHNSDVWEVYFTTTNHQLLKARFMFKEKGMMTMDYSLDNHSYTVHYEGIYGYPDPDMYSCDKLFFNLQKTEDVSNDNCPEHIYSIYSFEQRPFDMFIHVSYVDGDRLFVKDETNEFVLGY